MPNYKQFKRSLKHNRGINVDLDNTYDYLAYYNNNPIAAMSLANGDRRQHFIDRFKTWNHPTFSIESQYSTPQRQGGTWRKDNYGNYTFYHSPYTAKHLEDTDDYLGENVRQGGDVEMSYWNGSYRIPTLEVIAPRRRLSSMGRRSK